MLKTVVQVKPREDFKVYVYFDDGKIKLYDVNPLISNGGIFQKISQIDEFMNKCTVMGGTLAWDSSGCFSESDCIDIDPETIYSEGEEVSDPFTEIYNYS